MKWKIQSKETPSSIQREIARVGFLRILVQGRTGEKPDALCSWQVAPIDEYSPHGTSKEIAIGLAMNLADARAAASAAVRKIIKAMQEDLYA